MSDIEKIHGITPDLTRENVDRLLALFPDVATETTDPKTGRTERAVDFDALRERLGDVAEGCVLSSCYRPVWREFSFRKSGRF
ncbi:hypothetical protein ACJ8LF_03455 [Bifidobacterium bifidum]|uniref:hypothetical protein n=1 Tax=Bifidobacterium bifidum TaxID=1681 RepID=UPI003B9CC88D